MADPLKSDQIIEFGEYRFNTASGEIFKQSERIATLQPKVGETLRVLLENRGKLVTKDQLLKAVWGEVHIEESGLSRNICELRKVLGAEWIETLPRRGFRLRASRPRHKPERFRSLALIGVATAVLVVAAGAWKLRVSSLATGAGPAAAAAETFYVYRDGGAAENHFHPTGRMGDCGDISIDEADAANPFAGTSSIRIQYTASGQGPHACPYAPPCGWAGLYWQHPPHNWGKDKRFAGMGFDLSGYRRLHFAARSARPALIEFKVGGVAEAYGDSLRTPRVVLARLTPEWRQFAIDLDGADLKHIIGGFCWVTNRDANPQGITFWIDEIRFEKN